MKKTDIPILFTMKGSNYEFLAHNLFDAERNALTYFGKSAAVYHPPCRLWSRMKAFSTAPKEEKWLAIWAIRMIRLHGGVLEHPLGSNLLRLLPLPGTIDAYGGHTHVLSQRWFGHTCEKKTFVYIVGIRPSEVPQMPITFDLPTHKVSTSKRSTTGKVLHGSARSYTPLEFAKWLILIAELIEAKKKVLSIQPL